MRKIYITEEQLSELIDSSLMFSNETTPDYEASQISTTEPTGDDNYGEPITGDDHAKSMAPGLFQRLTSRGIYGGPTV